MKTKRGRGRPGKGRKELIKVRITPKDKKRIQAVAERADPPITVSTLMRMAAMNLVEDIEGRANEDGTREASAIPYWFLGALEEDQRIP
jgi:hypothetical protein